MIMNRRTLLASGAASVVLTATARAFPTPPATMIGFDVMRDGSKLGTHDLTFSAAGDALTVNVAVDLAYDIGPVTVFRYTHRAVERWQGDQVVSVETQTDDDGDDYTVRGVRDAAGLVVQATGLATYTAPPAALPATHWNRNQLGGPWINTQDGKLLRPQVADVGVETIAVADGRTLSARHYRMTGDAVLDIWYHDTMGWAGLSFVIDDTEIRYLRRI